MKQVTTFAALSLSIVSLLSCQSIKPAGSETASTPDPRLQAGEARRISNTVSDSASIFIDRQSMADMIPAEVLAEARCIASVKIIQGGFIFGGGGGDGMVSCRLPNGQWSAPSFLTYSKVNAGLEIGVSGIDMILVFMSDAGRQLLDHAQFNLGVDMELTAGPVGRHVAVGQTYESQILTYGNSRGLSINLLGLTGNILTHFPLRNAKVYANLGLQAGRDILRLDSNQAPQITTPWVNTLNRMAPSFVAPTGNVAVQNQQ